MASPFMTAGDLTFGLASDFPSLRGDQHAGWGLFWSLGYVIVAAILVIVTLRTFDRCLGRIPDHDGTARVSAPRASVPRQEREPMAVVRSKG
jgi:hypothetical protein